MNKILLNKTGLFFVLCLTMVCLCGCVSSDTNITIDRKGNATIEEKTLFNNDLLDLIKDGLSKKIGNIKAKDDPNFTVERLEESTATGTKITKKIYNIAENDLDFDELFMEDVIKPQLESGRTVDVKKGFFTTEYKINFNVDMKKDVDFVKAKLAFEIPAKAKNHNATSEDGKKHIYLWQITEPVQNVALEFAVLNVGNVLLCIVALGAVIFLGFFILYRYGKDKEEKV